MPQDLEPMASFLALRNQLRVSGTLRTETALRIGAGRASDVVGNDLPVLRDALNAPFLPGASLKGAMRASLEALIRSVVPGQARDLLETEDVMRKRIPELRKHYFHEGVDTTEADQLYSEALWRQATTMIDQTFGAPWLAGRVAFKDALIDRSLWFGQFEVRNGVALNRDTETAENGLLYDYEVVPAGLSFDFELLAENMEDWQLGMLLLALGQWEQGRLRLGGFRSRGLGVVRLVDTHYQFAKLRSGNVDDVLRLLCDPTTLAELNIAAEPVDVLQQRTAWIAAFRAELLRRLSPTEAEDA
ncbi:CRISPR-associated RAMP protein [Candidatus Gracilibacteria bacterium]|nr:CRISPR-associated RAMP protein [Candidatus Gracilibacteria bacterium]